MLGLNPWVLLGLAAAWLASVAGSGYLGYDYAKADCAREQLAAALDDKKLTELRQQLSDDMGAKVEASLSKIRIVQKTIQQEVRHEREVQTRVLDNPDCNLPDSTRRVLNRARGVDDPPRPSQPPGGVPKDAAIAGDDKAGRSR